MPSGAGTTGDRARELAREIGANADDLLRSARAQLGARLREQVESGDVAQQTLADALAALDGFETRSPDALRGWLWTILRHRICDADRRARRAAVLGSPGADASDRLEAVAATWTSPSGGAARTESLARLAAAMRQLPSAQRAALELRYFEGLDVPAVAARLARTDRAVRALCVRGLVALRRMLGDGG